MSRVLVLVAWLALAVALVSYDTGPRAPPSWYTQICADVQTC